MIYFGCQNTRENKFHNKLNVTFIKFKTLKIN